MQDQVIAASTRCPSWCTVRRPADHHVHISPAGKAGEVRVQVVLAAAPGSAWAQPQLVLRHLGGTPAAGMAKIVVPCTTASVLAVILGRLGNRDVGALIESAVAQVAS